MQPLRNTLVDTAIGEVTNRILSLVSSKSNVISWLKIVENERLPENAYICKRKYK
jgi:hypothetical protein